MFESGLNTRIIYSGFEFRVLDVFGCSNTRIKNSNKRSGFHNRSYSG